MHVIIHRACHRPTTWSRCRTLSRELNHFGRYLYATQSRTYDDAIELLNTLQTPYEVLKAQREANFKHDAQIHEKMKQHLHHLGYSHSDLNKLNIVHVTGTKGKGTTCAYVNSILTQFQQSHGLPNKIGLFTSPHLIAVRERIRINSKPISREKFAKYFFEVWDRLKSVSASDNLHFKPVYFRYLTLMSYHVFLSEKVDCAIYEVGVGGEYDATNVVGKPCVTGISTVGIDHTFQLGQTIEEIAWHKAGIMKQDVPAYYAKQTDAAMSVIQNRALEIKVKSCGKVHALYGEGVKIRPDAEWQRLNAGLGVALASQVMRTLHSSFEKLTLLESQKTFNDVFADGPVSLEPEILRGLEKMTWRGRCEVKKEGSVKWYLDGAHTKDSLAHALRWFASEGANKHGPKVLIFNQQGEREAVSLLEGIYRGAQLHGIHFDLVIFCPVTGLKKDDVNRMTNKTALIEQSLQREFSRRWRLWNPGFEDQVLVLPSVENAIEAIRDIGKELVEANTAIGSIEPNKKVHVLVTGSVHLVGRMLGALEGVDAL